MPGLLLACSVVVLLLHVMTTMLLSVVQLPFVREQLEGDNWTPKMEVEQGIMLTFAVMYLLMAWVVGCQAAQERWFSLRAFSHRGLHV